MWLHIPQSRSSVSAPAVQCSISEWRSACERSGSNPEFYVTLSGKPTLRPYSWRGWESRPWITLLSTPTLSPSQQSDLLESWLEEEWSSREYHALGTPSQASDSSSTTNGTFGLRQDESFGTFKPDGSFSKTCTASLFQSESESSRPAPEGSAESWPRTGGMRSGVCFQLPPLEPITSESGFLSWPSADAGAINDGESLETFEARRQRNLEKGYNGNGQGTPLAVRAAEFPAPPWPTATTNPQGPNTGKTRENGRVANRFTDQCLARVAETFPTKLWATASARDHKGINQHLSTRGTLDQLPNQAEAYPPTPPPETTTGAGCGYSELIQLLCRLFGVQSEAEFRAIPKALSPRFVEFLMGWD